MPTDRNNPMCPEFFHIGPIAIRAYGVALSLSFFIGLAIMQREARVRQVDPERIVTLGFVLIIAGVLGARLGYVLYHWSEFSNDLLAIINPFGGGEYFGIAGLNLQGGIVLALIAGLGYMKLKHMPMARTLDAVVPAMAFGIFLTRIGCFLNGCCFGTPTDSFLGVVFPDHSPAWYVFRDTPVHPAQLYSAAYGLFLFLLLRHVNRQSVGPGFTTGVYFVLEATFRFAIEFVRHYESAMQFQWLGISATFNQLVSLGLFLLGVAFLIMSRREHGELQRS